MLLAGRKAVALLALPLVLAGCTLAPIESRVEREPVECGPLVAALGESFSALAATDGEHELPPDAGEQLDSAAQALQAATDALGDDSVRFVASLAGQRMTEYAAALRAGPPDADADALHEEALTNLFTVASLCSGPDDS